MSDDATLQAKQARLRVLETQAAEFGNLCPPHIATEIDRLRREIARLDGGAARAGLPRPPQPDFAHPYPIQSGFTGRVAERTMLTGWLSSSPQPVLVVIGIGGMGKSALTWAWLQRDVLGLALPGAAPEPPEATACRLPEAALPEGVLWWSFYETQAGFASFLDEAIGYASDQRTNPRDIPSTYDKARTLLGLLQQRRLLLVLDGFERELRAYSSLGAAYQGDAVEKQERGEHRACADPHAGRFLRDAATLPLKSRILITSRLFPRELDDLAGCGRENLATIHPEDAVTFFHTQGIRGTRAEIQAACAPYGYHALALRLLAGLIKNDPTRPGDMRVTDDHNAAPELVQREHHVLALAYEALRPQLRNLLSMLAAFRSPVAFATLQAIYDVPPEQPSGFVSTIRRLFQRPTAQLDLKIGLKELEERGLLFFDRALARYDMHPVVRGYAYDRLDDKPVIHVRLVGYFTAVPALDRDKVQSLDDLLPTIELYHHTVRAGQYDQAAKLFRDRLHYSLYYRLGAYQTCIELLLALFPDSEEHPPWLKEESDQAWALAALGNAYSLSGQPRRAVPLFERHNALREAARDTLNLAIGLDNLATIAQLILGELEAVEHKLRYSIKLFSEIEDTFEEATEHYELGRALVYIGQFVEAEEEFALAFTVIQSYLQRQGLIWSYRSLRFLLMSDPRAALESAHKARELANVERVERDIIRAEWLIGAALVEQAASNDHDKLLTEAGTHLTEALTRCRRINLVDHEPDILLAWAKWHHLQGNAAQARADADEALAIADRCEYRLVQADIHNFLARLALDSGDRAAARRHAEIARERAWCDGPPHCYKPALDEAERLLGEIG